MLVRVVVGVAVLLSFQSSHNPAQRAQVPQASCEINILFFTASWCEPCRAVGPLLEKFVQDNKHRAKLTTIDFDSAKSEVARWHVETVPVVIVLSSGGALVLRQDGASHESLTALRSALDSVKKDLVKECEKR